MRCFLSALLTPYLYFRALSSGQRFVYSFFQDPSLSEPLAVQLCASWLTSFFDNPKLEELYIRGCSDISELEKLSGLKVFSFWNADISDLSYISSLHKLNDLEVRTSNDLDCRNIDQLCELEKLEIFGDLLSNYQSIADLPKLSYLSIQVDNYNLFDLSFIKQSDSIKKVTLWKVPEDKQQSIKEEFENSGIEIKFK